MEQILRYIKKRKLVIFAGAGVSMGGPANLPSWYALNDMLIDVLWDRVQSHFDISGATRAMFISRFREMRDAQTSRFPPDYQAQIMEEQAGADYFKSLASVDSTIYNETHHHIARLAKEGLVQCIITTNFDTMFENAFRALEVPFEAFYNNEGYKILHERLDLMDLDFVPIIKIHGTASDPSSMVDTLKQRLRDRSKSLNSVLKSYLQSSYFLYSGFSGADFAFDRNYLGIRPAASFSPGFTFAIRPGSKVNSEVSDLLQAYGSKAQLLESSARELFSDIAKSKGVPATPYPFSNFTPESNLVKPKLEQWVSEIDGMKAVNMLYALTESLGIEPLSRVLMDIVWNHRTPEDYETDSFPVFVKNLGKSYLFNLQNRLERLDSTPSPVILLQTVDLGEKTSESVEAELNSELLEFDRYDFGKAALHHEVNLKFAIGWARMCLMNQFEGREPTFEEFQDTNPELFSISMYQREQLDIFYYYCFYMDITADGGYFTKIEEIAIKDAVDGYDLPREGFLRAQYARILAKLDRIPEAKQEFKRASQIYGKLHDDRLLAEILQARGVIQRATGSLYSSLRSLLRARDMFATFYRLPQIMQCHIETLRTFNAMVDVTGKFLNRLKPTITSIRDESERFFRLNRLQGFEPAFRYEFGLVTYYWEGEIEQGLSYFISAYNLAITYKQPFRARVLKSNYEKLGLWGKIKDKVSDSDPAD
jgi:SIR2-like domain